MAGRSKAPPPAEPDGLDEQELAERELRDQQVRRINSVFKGPDPPAPLMPGGGEGGAQPMVTVRPMRDLSKTRFQDCSVAADGLADLRKSAPRPADLLLTLAPGGAQPPASFLRAQPSSWSVRSQPPLPFYNPQ